MTRLVNTKVGDQARQQYDALMTKSQNRATPNAELGGAYGEIGRLLMASEFFEAAEPFLRNAEALAPADRRWPYYLGHVYRLQGDAAKSASAFERALSVRSDDETTLVWLGRAYLDQGRGDAAEPWFKRAAAANPRSAAALYGLGRVALAARDNAHAAEYLEKALSLDTGASVIHYPLALAYRGLGKTAEAEGESRRRGDVEVGLADPLMDEALESLETSSAYESRAMRASASGDWRSAANYLRRSVELAPDDATLRAKLGAALSTTGDSAGAQEQFQAALRMSPGLGVAHLGLGQLLAASGRNREAVEQFSQAVGAAPDDVQAQFELAEVLRRLGRAQEARAHYESALRISPDMVEARYGYALTLVLLKRYQEARNRLTEDAKRFPDRPEFAEALTHLPSSDAGR
jgi:tetratricopeptide (TPR) repeat protein